MFNSASIAAKDGPGKYRFMSTSQFRQGSWMIMKGTGGDPDSVIYRLQPDDTKEAFYFLKVDENYLYLMDSEQNLLIGNELFSDTFNRVDPGT